MLGLPKLPDMWRVLKEADLHAIRREAERPFQVLLVAEDGADAERLGALLSGPDGSRHPWLVPADAAEARHPASSGMLDLAVLISPAPDLSPALGFAADALRAAKVPVVTVAYGSRSAMAAVVRPGEAARAAVGALDAPAVPAAGQGGAWRAAPGAGPGPAPPPAPPPPAALPGVVEATGATTAVS